MAALAALCEAGLGQTGPARSAVDVLLARLSGDPAPRPAHETIDMRWTCHQVLVALDDARAGPMLDRLRVDVQARAADLTDDSDRERLVQALPVFRDIVAAYGRRHRQAAVG